MPSLKHKPLDVIVVGGGVIGSAVAYYLSRDGARVALVERGPIASGTSNACDGNILAIDKQPGFDSQITLKSQELLDDLTHELDVDFEYRHKGSVLAVEDEEQRRLAIDFTERQKAAGLPMRYMEGSAVHESEPLLADDIIGLVECASDSSLEPMRLVHGLIVGARKHGAEIHTFTPVKSIMRTADGKVEGVRTSAGSFTAPNVVLAAGIWTPALARTVGVDVPITPRKGTILVCSGGPQRGYRKVTEFGYLMTKFQSGGGRDVEPDMDKYGIALVFEPTPQGNFLIGSSREFVGFDTTINRRVIQLLARRAGRFFPALRSASIIRTYAGLRPYTPDHLSIVSPVTTVPGLYIAAGHEGDGIGLAPITGKVISEMIGGKELSFTVDPLRLDRFDETTNHNGRE